MDDDDQQEDFLRHWTTDARGNRIRVGLTKTETDEYEAIVVKMRAPEEDAFPWSSVAEMNRDQNRYLELHRKHERARIAVLASENELRIDKPTRH